MKAYTEYNNDSFTKKQIALEKLLREAVREFITDEELEIKAYTIIRTKLERKFTALADLRNDNVNDEFEFCDRLKNA